MRFGEGERGGGEDASARYSRSTCGRVSFRADRFGDSITGAGAFGDPGERSDGLVMIICGFAKDSDHDSSVHTAHVTDITILIWPLPHI
jgi:hypothetical protein